MEANKNNTKDIEIKDSKAVNLSLDIAYLKVVIALLVVFIFISIGSFVIQTKRISKLQTDVRVLTNVVEVNKDVETDYKAKLHEIDSLNNVIDSLQSIKVEPKTIEKIVYKNDIFINTGNKGLVIIDIDAFRRRYKRFVDNKKYNVYPKYNDKYFKALVITPETDMTSIIRETYNIK